MSSEDLRIEQMVDEILSGAKAEAKKITTEAKKQVAEIEERAKLKAEQEKQAILEAQLKQVKELEKQQIASLNLQAKREILQKKEDAISNAFDLAKKELEAFHKKAAYSKVLEKLIIEAGIALNGGNLVILARKQDKSKIKDLTNLAKQITKATGNKCSLKIGKETITAIGGVILKTDDNSITIDNTFDARLEQKYREIRTEVANQLFEDK